MDLHWWSIEVRNSMLPAAAWRAGYGEILVEAALTHGVRNWHWGMWSSGVVLELGFADYDDWARFRSLPLVTAALDAVPDPINGLYVYPGRGGSAAASLPRRGPRPLGAGAAPLPEEPAPVVVARPELLIAG
jgi:hypothetical protein